MVSIILLGLGYRNVVKAQAYRAQVFSLGEGLAQSQVMSMCQDRRGYIWMGTKTGGVSRFDGRGFKTYTTDDGLLGNEVAAIAEDRFGNLWFACNQKGICWYDGYQFRAPRTSGMPAFRAASQIFCGPRGEIMLATQGSGLFVWDGKTLHNYTRKDGLPSDSIYAIEPIGPEEIWLGTAAGIAIFKGAQITALSANTYIDRPQEEVCALTHLRNGSLAGSNGNYFWSLHDDRFYYDTLAQPIELISSVLQDNEGGLWLTGNHLAARVSIGQSYRLGVQDGLKETKTNCLLLDRNGNMWIGTDGAGAVRYSPEAFTMYGAGTPFEDRSVFAVLELEPDHMLVGTERGLFEVIDGKVITVPGKEVQDANIRSLNKEADGTIVLTTYEGAYRWDGKTFTPVRDVPGGKPQLFSRFSRRYDGQIFATNDQGFYKIEKDSSVLLKTPGVDFRQKKYAVFLDHQSRIWFYTLLQSLVCWDGDRPIDMIAKYHLPISAVFDVKESADSTVWIATDNGIYGFKNNSSCYVDTKEGLTGNVVYLLQFDSNGNLWAGTGNGLTRIGLSGGLNVVSTRAYGKVEGFTGIECNLKASCMDSKGRLWFGTIEGLSCYHPDRDIEDRTAPTIEISEFKVKLGKVDWASRGIAVAPWTNVPVDAVLNPDEEDVRIQFTGVTQHLGENVQYRYVLLGLDTAYSIASKENYRVYSPLRPGDYTFKVIACNANGVWTPQPAILHFTIRTPYWKTSWFGVIVFLLVIVALMGIVRLRTNSLQRQRAILEQKVKQRTEALEQANQVKGEFLAKMSHEIRTPMNGVIGMTDLLERTALTPQQSKFVSNIRVSGQNLLGLINDILDFSRIESGKLELEEIPFDLRHTMEEVMDILSFSAFSKGLELLLWVDPEIRGPIQGDPSRIKQILTNLVGNAVKFTSSGEIILRAQLIAREGDHAIIQCSIKDSGIGIPKEKHATLFESFTQVDASTTRKYGGTGLGLAISYNLSRMMGGEMWVESEVGQGSEFCFTFKSGVSGPWHFPGDAHPAKALEGRKIIVALNHLATQVVLAEYLKHWGMEMYVYPSIEAATDAALDLADVSFLLVDMRLSHGDPSKFAQRIASICKPRGLSYGLMAEPDVSIPLQAVVGDRGWILSKPFKRDDLLQALVGIRLGNEVQATVESLSQMSNQVPLRILVAEDNPINQDVALGMLGSLGYEVAVVENGRQAVEVARKGMIDLIFMDVQMPVMDGLEATRQIIAHFEGKQRPLIVAMTANAMESDRQNCLEAGMDTFISKPFLMNELVRMLRTVPALRSAKQAEPVTVAPRENLQDPPPPLPAVVAPPSSVPPVVAPPTPKPDAEYKLTDMSMLESVSNGEPAFVLGIITKLVAKLPEAILELRDAIASADWELVRATAHRNKSSAAYSGSEALKEKFKDLELLAREREHLELIPEKMDDLDAFAHAVVEELKRHIAERTK